MHAGDLIIVAGRPSMGKTSFALNIGEHVAIDQGLPIAVFSMEMGAEQLALRMLCSVGRIDAQRLRTGRLQEDDWDRLTHCVSRMMGPRFTSTRPLVSTPWSFVLVPDVWRDSLVVLA